jgi:hypothetical protein
MAGMSKVRINDLARELEVKSNEILDALKAVGVTEKKTHSSSIESDEAEKVRGHFKPGARTTAAKAPVEKKETFSLKDVSKPGDALKAILERKQAEAAAKNAPPPRPAAVAVAPRCTRACTSRARCARTSRRACNPRAAPHRSHSPSGEPGGRRRAASSYGRTGRPPCRDPAAGRRLRAAHRAGRGQALSRASAAARAGRRRARSGCTRARSRGHRR